MKRSRFSEEQIIAILKEHEAGVAVSDLCRKHGVSDGSIYKWKGKCGGMNVPEAKISFFVDGAQAIYRSLACLNLRGYVAYADPPELADPAVLVAPAAATGRPAGRPAPLPPTPRNDPSSVETSARSPPEAPPPPPGRSPRPPSGRKRKKNASSVSPRESAPCPSGLLLQDPENTTLHELRIHVTSCASNTPTISPKDSAFMSVSALLSPRLATASSFCGCMPPMAGACTA
jgi:putative transposase